MIISDKIKETFLYPKSQMKRKVLRKMKRSPIQLSETTNQSTGKTRTTNNNHCTSPLFCDVSCI